MIDPVTLWFEIEKFDDKRDISITKLVVALLVILSLTILLLCLYQPDLIYVFQKEVTNCDNYKRTKQPNKKYGDLPAKLAE